MKAMGEYVITMTINESKGLQAENTAHQYHKCEKENSRRPLFYETTPSLSWEGMWSKSPN